MKDEQIVELFWKRSEEALSETQSKYEKYCIYISWNILGNNQDAEECVNEALNAAWNSIPPQKPSNLQAYIGKLVREIYPYQDGEKTMQPNVVPANLVYL